MTTETDMVTSLIRDLVRAPSRPGVDDYGPVVDVLAGWMRGAGLAPRVLTDGGQPVAVAATVAGERPGRHLVLDACLDTAQLGDESAWSVDPFGGEVRDGWLYGRGAADSKAAVAVFSHLAARLEPGALAGSVTVLADLDEHNGTFRGIRRFLEETGRVDGVLIGYPGTDRVVVGGRGVLRVRCTVHGEAGHTGSSRPVRNALVKAARLVQLLLTVQPRDIDPELGLPGKVTVTTLEGGAAGSFSVVPDTAVVEVDVRLVPSFDAAAAEAGASCVSVWTRPGPERDAAPNRRGAPPSGEERAEAAVTRRGIDHDPVVTFRRYSPNIDHWIMIGPLAAAASPEGEVTNQFLP